MRDEPGVLGGGHQGVPRRDEGPADIAMFAPVSGEVVEVNERLRDSPELVNTDPYGDGWMIRVKLSDASELDALMGAEEYDEYCEAESGH